eukprot:scaffold84_cov388-Prasinococcus_capsulatus_cf.AAC.13
MCVGMVDHPDYAPSGIAVMAPKGSTFLNVWNSALPIVLGSTEYQELCVKYGISTCLGSNSNGTSLLEAEVPAVPQEERIYRLAIGLDFPVLDFVGPMGLDTPGYPIKGFSNEVALMVCEEAGVRCQFVVDDYNGCFGREHVEHLGFALDGFDWAYYASEEVIADDQGGAPLAIGTWLA